MRGKEIKPRESETGRKRLRMLRRRAHEMKPPCDDCPKRSECELAPPCSKGPCNDCPERSDCELTPPCSKMEEYLSAVLPGAESVPRSSEVLKGLVYRIAPVSIKPPDEIILERIDKERISRDDTVLVDPAQIDDDRKRIVAIADLLLEGKLTFEAIADLQYTSVDEITRIKDAALALVGPRDPIVFAIIQERLTGTAAAARFKKPHEKIETKQADISRRLKRASKVLRNSIDSRTFFERGFMETKKCTLRIDIDERLAADLKAISKRVGLPLSDLISGMTVRWIAEREARRKAGTEEMLYEFALPEGSKEPFDVGTNYRLILSQAETRERGAWGERARLLEATGQPLDDTQRDFLEADRREAQRMRHAVTQALNAKQDALQARIKYQWIPAAFPDDLLRGWLELIRLEKATVEQLREFCRNWTAPADQSPDGGSENRK